MTILVNNKSFKVLLVKYMLVIYFERPKSIYTAMALVPPIVLLWKEKQIDNYTVYKHECIHHRQILELLIFPFFLWYGIEYVLGRLKGMKHFEAYKNISFEKEAYYGENVAKYASKPRWYGFLKFIGTQNSSRKQSL